VLLIVAALAFGMVVTAAVAIGVSLSSSLYTRRGERELASIGSMTPRYLADEWVCVRAVRQVGTGWGSSSTELMLVRRDDGASNADVEGLNWNQGPARLFVTRFELGWPFRSLGYDQIGVNGGLTPDETWALIDETGAAAGRRDGLLAPHWIPVDRQRGPRYVPLDPIPLGFAADTAVFGGLFWVIVCAPGMLRRAVRRRAGRCEACGYTLEGLEVCPECGASA
jgi:hypothetical protein